MDETDVFAGLRQRCLAGDAQAESELWDLVYSEMKKLAHYRLAGSKPVSLSPTMLVHEVYLKLGPPEQISVTGRAHFTAVVCRAMRFILADYARRKGAEKRGVFLEFATLVEEGEPAKEDPFELVVLNEAVEKLEKIDERLSRVVECRYFGGLSTQETAEALNLSQRNAERLWSKAKLYLYQHLKSGARNATR